MTRASVAVTIAGHDYKIRSDVDPEDLRQVAGYVDAAMQKIRRQTGTHDSFDVAVLTCLNLARDILAMRDRLDGTPGFEQIRSLAEQVEQSLTPSSALPGKTTEGGAEAASKSPEKGEADLPDASSESAAPTEATVHSVDIHLERVAERAAEAKAQAEQVEDAPGALAAGEAKR